MDTPIQTSTTWREDKYEIRVQLASRADELGKRGYEIISLHIGNHGLFGSRTPETIVWRCSKTPAKPKRTATRRVILRHKKQ